ncbi:MAG TPA: PAS domain S-box protein [Thermodesulfobacteriota bacterium]|nr:PAS domain S-box protein [Deltaproteobacteria bacterium]HNR12250.1 PAS domain S-box protein [Thermodesulfobacteriota bacterium]HQO78237.1 PAS domain S-box protein [Thermodesulfobacteriota bacterium]
MKHKDTFTSKQSFFSGLTCSDVQHLIERLPFTVIVLNAHGQVVYVNEWGEKVYQCTFDDIHHRPLADILFVSDPDILANALAVAYKGKVVFNVRWQEEQYYEGRVFWREATFIPFFAETGDIEYVMVTVNDITEHVRSQKMLIKSQEQYRRIFECAPVAIVILERGIIRGSNPAWELLSGYSQEDLLGTRVERIVSEEHTSGISWVEKLETAIDKAQAGEVQSLTMSWKTNSGDIISTCITIGSTSSSGSITPGALVEVIIQEV